MASKHYKVKHTSSISNVYNPTTGTVEGCKISPTGDAPRAQRTATAIPDSSHRYELESCFILDSRLSTNGWPLKLWRHKILNFSAQVNERKMVSPIADCIIHIRVSLTNFMIRLGDGFKRGHEICAIHIRTVAAIQNDMNLGYFNRFWVTFVGN